MNRVTARTHAMKLIYEWEMGGEGGEETRLNLLGAQPGEEEYAFMERMFQGVVENVAALDESIEKNARGWKLERISKVDLAILRLAAYEISLGKTSENIVINDLAARLDMSPGYFSSTFKREVHQSTMQYITALRIERAREYLENTDQSVAMIAKSVGYEDSQYFFRVFKKATGQTPAAFRAAAAADEALSQPLPLEKELYV